MCSVSLESMNFSTAVAPTLLWIRSVICGLRRYPEHATCCATEHGVMQPVRCTLREPVQCMVKKPSLVYRYKLHCAAYDRNEVDKK